MKSKAQKKILILGATSSIAKHTAIAFAEKKHTLFLAGRHLAELERMAVDLKIRYGIQVKTDFFDAEKFDEHKEFIQKVHTELDGFDGVVVAFGDLGDQTKAVHDFEYAHHIFHVNFMGACSALTHAANYFVSRKHGFIIGISSVAGDRGRQSNYVYGSSKAGMTSFLEGMRNRLYSAGIRVITIKPGPVDTPMVFGKGMGLVASPQYVGKKIADSLDHYADVLYLPWFWRYIMFIVRSIPEFIFKRLKL